MTRAPFALALALTFACATSPPTPAPTPTLAPTPTPTSTSATPSADPYDLQDLPSSPKAGVKYLVVVSFGSECCGPDRKAEDALDAVVARYPRPALGHARGHWGKEGERDDCFTLAGLSAADRARFVADVRANVAGKLTKVAENASCHADR